MSYSSVAHERLRVLQLTGFYRPHLGGLERVVETLSRELAARGNEVTVATTGHPTAPAHERDGSVDVIRLRGWSARLPFLHEDPTKPFAPPAPDPGLTLGLLRLLRRVRPDVIHAHDWLVYSLLALPRLDVPVLLSLHDYSLICPKKSYLHGGRICSGPGAAKCVKCASSQYGPPKALAIAGLLRTSGALLNGRLTRILPVSSAVRQAAAAGTGLAPEAFEVVPAPIAADLSSVAYGAPRPPFLPDGDFILFVGALGPHKGLDVLLDAYSRMAPGKPPLVVIGMPRKDSPAVYPDGVTVIENAPHEVVVACYEHAMFTVVPSTGPDALPQVAAESAVVGCAVVASAAGGLPELVRDGVTGLLVEPGDREELRAAMESLVADPKRREDMGAASREHARRFHVDKVVDRLERLYRDASESLTQDPSIHGS
jgi:glycosyltransferase involved in cell wall biosynthesis